MEYICSELSNLGYEGPINNESLQLIFTHGPPNLHFVEIVAWLSSQLVPLCNLENCVMAIDDEEDLDTKAIGFFVEISSLLKELGCPLKRLTKGPLEDRLILPNDKINTILYLCQELEAGKILASKNSKQTDPVLIELSESDTAKEIREMAVSLGFGKPPDNFTPQQLFTGVEKKLYSLSQHSSPRDIVGGLLFSGYLTEKQWFQLDKLFNEVHYEYKTRRNLLITRLDVTIQSFMWAERLKSKTEEIRNNYSKQRSGIIDVPKVKISDILSATPDLAVIEKTSSASVRMNTQSFINKHKIGPVPDRGGRPDEQKPPPPEIPSWQKTDASTRGGPRQTYQQGSNNFRSAGERGGYRSRNDNDNRPNSDNYRNENYNNNRNTYHAPACQPHYQQAPCYTQMGIPQYGGGGFGGYVAAGDNFSQFGGLGSMHSQDYANAMPNQRGGFRGGFRGRRGRAR